MTYLVKQHSHRKGLFGKEETVEASSIKSAAKKYRKANNTGDAKIGCKNIDGKRPVWLYVHPKYNFRVTE